MPLAAPRSVVAARPTNPVTIAWAKKVLTPTRIIPVMTASNLGASKSGRPIAARPRPLQCWFRSGRSGHLPRQGSREERWHEDKINKASRHHADGKRRPDEHKIDIGENANEGEENAKADHEGGAKGAIAQMRGKHMCCGVSLRVLGLHRLHMIDRQIDEDRAGDIEASEDKEVTCQAEMIGDRRR